MRRAPGRDDARRSRRARLCAGAARAPGRARRAGDAAAGRAAADDPDDHGQRQSAPRAGYGALLHRASPRRALRSGAARRRAARPLRDRVVRRRADRRRRHRRPRRPGSRESGHQPHRARGQPAAEGRQDPAGNPARAAADLHPQQGPRRCRPDHRALPAPGPLRRPGRTADRPARPEPGRRGVRDQRGAAFARPPDQHHRQRAVWRRPADRRDGDARSELESTSGKYDLRSRSARLRPAEAAPILPDARLCGFPRRLGGRRAHARPARLHHHLCGGGRAALSFRYCRRRKRYSRLQRRRASHPAAHADRQLVQCPSGRRHRDAAQRAGRPVRLCVLRRATRSSRAIAKR